MAARSNRTIAELDDLNVLTEDGYREFTERAVALEREWALGLNFIAQVLGNALRVTPCPLGNQGAARTTARQVRSYLMRASNLHIGSAGQISAAWTKFEGTFLVPVNYRGAPSGGMALKGTGDGRNGGW